MKLEDFDYNLPEELIASFPSRIRSESRLLHLTKEITDRSFKDLPDLLSDKDALVVNNTSVMKARILGRKNSGAKVEILIERITGDHLAYAQTKSNSRLKIGDVIQPTTEGPSITLIEKKIVLSLFKFSIPVREMMRLYGRIPLPPYIKREDTEFDIYRYQTIYADPTKTYSVASPTAGLHFEKSLLESLAFKGVKLAEVTLHVGMGTFKPIKENLIENHKMHKEVISIDQTAVEVINTTKERNGKIICVGTTSLRCLEAVCRQNNGQLVPFEGETDLFIYPGFKFQIVDSLITNFHLPRSTLLVLVSAFAGHKRIMSAYKYAIEENYRFYSYGDAMFVEPEYL